MSKKTKILIFGTTCAGKTSVANVLKDKYSLNVIDLDDEARKVRQDIFINRDEKLLANTFESINNKVLEKVNVIFTSSFMYSPPEKVLDFHNNGFTIIHLYASLDESIKRRTTRHGGFLSEDRLERVKLNHTLHMEILNNDMLAELLDYSLDTTLYSKRTVTEKVISYLKNNTGLLL